MTFDLCVGIDYSGAQTPTSRLKSLQIYAAKPGQTPEAVKTPAIAASASECRHAQSTPRYWTRAEIAQWLIGLAHGGVRYIAGIDHGFSFPESYFKRNGLSDWPQFLDDFVRHWPTDQDHVYVDFVREGVLAKDGGPPADARVGRSNEFRLCEHWTSSCKSVFQFDIQGSVAKSTHAGIPWLKRIRETTADRVHIWPFDGWEPPAADKAVIAEVYRSIFRNRWSKEARTADEQDAYAVASWLSESAARGTLSGYFNPPLTPEERRVADIEGWILGVRWPT